MYALTFGSSTSQYPCFSQSIHSDLRSGQVRETGSVVVVVVVGSSVVVVVVLVVVVGSSVVVVVVLVLVVGSSVVVVVVAAIPVLLQAYFLFILQPVPAVQSRVNSSRVHSLALFAAQKAVASLKLFLTHFLFDDENFWAAAQTVGHTSD